MNYSGLDRALLSQIANPQLYYVNIHNDDFPAGAVRASCSENGRPDDTRR
jgi:hypothetical protein